MVTGELRQLQPASGNLVHSAARLRLVGLLALAVVVGKAYYHTVRGKTIAFYSNVDAGWPNKRQDAARHRTGENIAWVYTKLPTAPLPPLPALCVKYIPSVQLLKAGLKLKTLNR